eukprot:s3536_g11.t1
MCRADSQSSTTSTGNRLAELLPYSLLPRKRRRQAWHAKRALRGQKKTGKHSTRKSRATKDNGVYEEPLGKPRRTITIGEKLKVVRFYKELRDLKQKAIDDLKSAKCKENTLVRMTDGSERRRSGTKCQEPEESAKRRKVNLEKECQKEFPGLLKRITAVKWVKRSEIERWEDLPEYAQNKLVETPNTWRNKIGLPCKGRVEGGMIPLLLQQELDRLVVEMTAGSSDISERKEVATAENIASWPHSTALAEDSTITSLVQDWNASLEQNGKIIEDSNAKLKQQLEAGVIDPREFLAGFQPAPRPVEPPSQQWSKWFLRAWGWSLLSRQSDAQQTLPYEHYDMVQARSQVADIAKEAHGALIINFDQLWRASWQFGGKLLYKDRAKSGLRAARKKAPKRMEKKLHSIKGFENKDLRSSGQILQEDPSTKQWQSLPYEIASAFVRTLSLHWRELMDAKSRYESLVAKDEGVSNSTTRKARKAWKELRSKERFIIMNKRTCQLATQDWIARNIATDKDGIPHVKTGKRVRPWVMVMKVTGSGDGTRAPIEMTLQLTAKAPAAPVRCWQLHEAQVQTSIPAVLAGYDFGEDDQDDQDDQDDGDERASDAGSDDTRPGDEAGAAELQPVQNGGYLDPAPAPMAGEDVWVEPISDDPKALQCLLLDDDPSTDEEDLEGMMTELQNDEDAEGEESTKIAKEAHGVTHVPACFFERDVFCKLEKENLTCFPPTNGLKLSYHSQSQQWHAKWVDRKLNFAPSWGATRSEMKSLLLSIKQLWVWHLSINKDDHAGHAQLASIKKKLSTVKF